MSACRLHFKLDRFPGGGGGGGGGPVALGEIWLLPKEVNSEVILLPNEAKFYAITK